MFQPSVKMILLPGGKEPQRMTSGAIGYDVFLRAIVPPSEKETQHPHLRKNLFDFIERPEPGQKSEEIDFQHVVAVPVENSPSQFELAYSLAPGEQVLGGIGFITEMPFPLADRVAPRSGLASRFGIRVTNAPGTVDPDYRGEAGVVILNGSRKPFILRRGLRIAQIIFFRAIIPAITLADSLEALSETARNSGGFGSTGLR